MPWSKRFERFFAENDYQSVIDLSAKIDRKKRFSARHYAKYVASLYFLEQTEKGYAATEEAIAQFPDDCGLRVRHAENAMRDRDWEIAIARWTYIIDNFEGYPQGVFLMLARAHLQLFNFAAARQVADDARRLYGDDQKLIDLVSLIESAEAKRYALNVKRLPSALKYKLESVQPQKKIGRIHEYRKYRLHGWVRVGKGVRCSLLVKDGQGHTDCHDLNVDRLDVQRHLQRKNTSAVASQCGFDYVVDISRGVSIGFAVNGTQEWVARLEPSGILDVLEGKDGWLFLDNDGNKSVSQFTGELSLSEEMAAGWQAYARALKHSRQAGNLVFFVANAKERVVPEFHPRKQSAVSVADAVESIFSSESVDFLNIQDTLANAAGSYYKTDTHWSDYGGYLAYLSVMDKYGFRDVVRDIEFDEVEVVGDLGSKLSPQRRSYKKVHRFDGPKATCVFNNGISGTGSINVYANKDATYDKTVVLFGGSSLAGGSFARYFTYSFSRVVAINLPGSLVREIVDAESPDLVVLQTNERYLLKPGAVYGAFANVPGFRKVASLSVEEREKVLAKVREYPEEAFYVERMMGVLGEVAEGAAA